VIGCEDRLQNDLYCVRWGVKLYSNSNQTKAVKRFLVQFMNMLQTVCVYVHGYFCLSTIQVDFVVVYGEMFMQ